jgi:hypothetical protein
VPQRNFYKMNSAFYFVCAFRFSCTSCKQVTVEQLIASHHKFDPGAVVKSLMKQTFNCQCCLKPITDGTNVDIHVEPATRERLKVLGFSPPRPI